MKNYKISALILAAMASAGVSYAGTFGFEDVSSSLIPQNTGALQADAYSGGSYGAFTTSSSGINASIEYAFSFDNETYSGYWAGSAVSNQKDNDSTDFGNDLQSKPGGAASGENFAVMYLPSLDMSDYSDPDVMNNTPVLKNDPVFGNAYCTIFYKNCPNVTSIITDQSVKFTTIDVALTAYDYYVLENGNYLTGTVNEGAYHPVTNPYKSISNTEGSFFALRIYGLVDESGTLTEDYVDTILASNDGGEVFISPDWMTINVASLSEGLEEGLKGLSFQLISNFGNGGGLTMPNYIAIDNVNFAVPEPAEVAAMLGLVALALAISRRKISSRK